MIDNIKVEAYDFDSARWVVECQLLVDNGLTYSEIVVHLQQRGLSPVDSVEVISDLYRIDMTSGKKIVFSHPTWRIAAEDAAELHEAIINALRKEGTLVEEKNGFFSWTEKL